MTSDDHCDGARLCQTGAVVFLLFSRSDLADFVHAAGGCAITGMARSTRYGLRKPHNRHGFLSNVFAFAGVVGTRGARIPDLVCWWMLRRAGPEPGGGATLADDNPSERV